MFGRCWRIAIRTSTASHARQSRFHFFAAVPSPPTGPLEIRLVGHNTSTLEWGIPESDGGAPLEGYNIAIRDISKTMWMEVGRVPAGTQKFHLKDLHDEHEYLIRIFARNEIGSSEPLESDEPYKVERSGGKWNEDEGIAGAQQMVFHLN